nr:recombinase family protein [Amylibacter sp.]
MVARTEHSEGLQATKRRGKLQKLAVGYVRVSTVEQGKNGISLEAQRTAVQEFASLADYSLIETFEDVASGVGEKSFDGRKNIQAAIDLVIRSDADLLVWDWDRLSRHGSFEKQILKRIPDRNRIVCVKDGNRLHKASTKAVFKHSETVAKEISQRTKEGMQKKRDEGAVFGNPDIVKNVQPFGAAKWTEIVKNQDQRIAEILSATSDPFGLSYTAVADLLKAKGLVTLQGKQWTKSRVRNPVLRARKLLWEKEEVTSGSKITFGMF